MAVARKTASTAAPAAKAAPTKAAPAKPRAAKPKAPKAEATKVEAQPVEAAKVEPPKAEPAPTAAKVDLLDRSGEQALALAMDRPWSEITLRDIARAADVSFAELYARAPGKDALLDHMARRFDAAALASAEADDGGEAHDRLFEAAMARLEAMAPHRDALIAVARSRGLLAIAPHLPRTAKALLEAAGIDTGGPVGAIRIAGMTRVWARTLQVWRDDQGALNRTMAEIDKQLRTLNQRLKRIGAGF